MAGIKLTDFTEKSTPEAGDVLYLSDPGASPREERKLPIESVARLANPRGFVVERVSDGEVTATITSTGWYTIAESEDIANIASASDLMITFGQQSLSAKVTFSESVTTKDSSNTYIELTGKSGILGAGRRLESIRLAKSDSVNGSGAKIQIYAVVGSSDVLTVQIQNVGTNGQAGFALVTPYLDNGTVTLPDGVTTATFLEAGAEYAEDYVSAAYDPNITIFKASNDILRWVVNWTEIPKQNATGLTITHPSTQLVVGDGAGTLVVLTSGSYTISNVVVSEKVVRFIMTQVGAFTTLNNGPIGARFNGTGGKLTLT